MSEPIDNKALQTLVEDAADKLLAIAAECLRRGVETDATLARAERAEALLKEAVEALAKEQWSLQPFSDCVFNDNGDLTVTVSDRVTSADCLTDAHFAYKRIRATLAHIQETKP